MKKKVDALRATPWSTLLDESVTIVKDYAQGIDGLPKSNVLRFETENYKVLVRPSGTEPKLKIYFQAIGKTEADAKKRIADLVACVSEKI